MATTDDLARELAQLRDRVDALESATGLFATDGDLASNKGDPVVKFVPRDWRGPDCKGRTYSRCPAGFLDVLAETLTWMAAHPKEGKEKYAAYDAADARRARSWARRIRAGWRPPDAPAVGEFPGDPAPAATFEAPAFEAPAFGDVEDDIPF